MHSNYIQRLDLGDDPFRFDFRCPFFYAGANRQKNLDQLMHYGRFSAQPVVLIGEAGSGKRHLIRKLIEELGASLDVYSISAGQVNEEVSILAVIAQQLSITLDGQQSVKSFVDGIRYTLPSDDELDPFLLTIEDADCLVAQELESLFLLNQQLVGAMHLILVYEQINSILDAVVQQSQIALKRIELIPLSLQETAEFIESSLLAVGFAGEFPLNQQQLADIQARSQGNFAKIKQQTALLLNAKPAPNPKSSGFRANIPLTHILAIVVLATAMTVAYLYEGSEIGGQNAENISTYEPMLVEKNIDKPASAPNSSATDSIQERRQEKVKQQLGEIENKPKDLTGLKARSLTVVQSEEKVLPFNTHAVAQSSENALHNQVLVAAADNARVADTRESQLLAMPAGIYMLQLLGVSNEGSAVDFIELHASQLPLTYFQTVLKGNPWYVVLAGPYKTRKEAVQAKVLLPKAIREQSWVRSIVDIQADIRKSPQFLIKESIEN